MGMQTVLLGYVAEARPSVSHSSRNHFMEHVYEVCRHNEQVLGALPEVDEWPLLCRSMFAFAGAESQIVYKNRLIHLAATVNNMDMEFRDWLDKFEQLLRRLYWEEAFIRYESAYMGIHEFTWTPDREWVAQMCRGKLSPIRQWSFSSTLPLAELEQLREPRKKMPG